MLKGKADGFQGLHIDRRHAMLEIGVERFHIGIAHALIFGEGHGRIEVRAVAGHALAHGTVEIGEAPLADARRLGRRDVGAMIAPMGEPIA
jgi:hypothetical protein